MRRRSKRGPNESESTGKIGQELPADQPKPLIPAYLEQHAPSPEEVYGTDATETQLVPESPEEIESPVLGEDLGEIGSESDAAADGPATEIPENTEPVPSEGKLVVETQPESPSQPPPEPQAAAAPTARSPKGYVVLTIGLPGSGKTTWFKRRGVTPLSSDMLRSILFDDITEQRYQGLVFSTLRSLLRARLIAKMPWNYVDATNLSPHERRQWIKMAKSFGYDVQAVFFDVPLEVCLERNRRRERTVSEEIMHKMADRLRPPSFKEGFSKIVVVRVKGATAPAAEAAPAAIEAPEIEAPEAEG